MKLMKMIALLILSVAALSVSVPCAWPQKGGGSNSTYKEIWVECSNKKYVKVRDGETAKDACARSGIYAPPTDKGSTGTQRQSGKVATPVHCYSCPDGTKGPPKGCTQVKCAEVGPQAKAKPRQNQ